MAYPLFLTRTHSQSYTKYRPVYPANMYETIYQYCSRKDGGLDFAVDIGCGEGRSTFPLSRYFKKVIGLDLSESQIQEAKTKIPEDSDVSFISGPAEDLSFLEESSVDLITVGMAMHWMDMEKVNREIDRVLRPGGVVALYQYSEQIFDNQEAEDYVTNVFENQIIPMSQLPPERIKFTANHYKMPYDNDCQKHDFVMAHQWSVDDFVNYYLTVSFVNAVLRNYPETTLIEEMRERLKSIFTNPDTQQESTMAVKFDLILVLCRKQKSQETRYHSKDVNKVK